MTQVNRHLKYPDMDRIDHALGRPVHPEKETYRNHYAASECEADQFSLPNWQETHRYSDLVFFSVTEQGRVALRNHLREIGDKTRLFTVTFRNQELTPIPAETHSKAKYAKWCELDQDGLSFGEFCAFARVRLT